MRGAVATGLLAVFTWTSPAQGACQGSGLAWTCAPGSSSAEINDAINRASDNAVITFAAGTYGATDLTLNPRNGLTVICASPEACTMTGSRVFTATHTETKTNLTRISGFLFTNPSGGPTLSFGYSAGNPGYVKLRVDHNRFRQTSGSSIATGHTQSTNSVLGVIDHNTFEGDTHAYPLIIFGGGDSDWGPSWQGTGSNLFIEDNTFDFANENLGASGMDVWNGGRVVVRHNRITNARVAVHGTCHGGPANLEVYNNTIVGGAGSGDGYRLVHHQGSGEFLVFGNRLTPNTASMSLLHYRSYDPNPEGCGTCDGTQTIDGNRSPTTTYRGYPCWRQPGRTGDRQLRPMYFWDNAFAASGALARMNLDSPGGTTYLPVHLMQNRDWFEALSNQPQTTPTTPFNGSNGMGYGTLSRRPSACAPGTEVADVGQGGVGYFATDVGPQGTLYRCSAADTWSVHYTPYFYPHPLTRPSTSPSSPSQLRVL